MAKAPTKIQPYQCLIEHPDVKPYPGVDRESASCELLVQWMFVVSVWSCAREWGSLVHWSACKLTKVVEREVDDLLNYQRCSGCKTASVVVGCALLARDQLTVGDPSICRGVDGSRSK